MNLLKIQRAQLVRKLRKNINRSFKLKAGETQEFITLFFKDEREIIDPYSAGELSGSAIINPAVIEYLGSRVSPIPPKKKITIEIEYGGNVSVDPYLPEKLIKKKLEQSLFTSFRKNFRIMVSSFALALAGLAILGFINKIPYFTDRYAFNELFVVVSWVFIWRFVEMFFFERIKLRHQHSDLLKIYLAEYRIKTPV